MPGRTLIVTADDFGIGPATSRGILTLGKKGIVTSTVLLVNSPYAEDGVKEWQKAGRPLELGWHPCLTLDAPLLPPERIPTLVGPDGRFLKLGELLKRLMGSRVNELEIEAELSEQYKRFIHLVGQLPLAVNGHHHCHIFPPVGRALRRILNQQEPKPFIRRVGECRRTLLRVPGARIKRLLLGYFGRNAAKHQGREGFPGTELCAGITDPPFVKHPHFFERWLRNTPGNIVELTCHPGELDMSIEGRDGSLADGQLQRRAREYELLSQPEFLQAVQRAGFTLQPAFPLQLTQQNKAA